MPLTLDATAGGAAADSYYTLAEATAYCDDDSAGVGWLMLSDDAQAVLLAQAARMLDTYVRWEEVD